MQKISLLMVFSLVALLCGCGKQEKINAKKIDLLSEKLAQMDQQQAKQMALMQAQLSLLAPQIDKANSSYFEKNRDDALFFHTNTLYLLLTIGQQIEAQLQNADAERTAQNNQIYNYHTNQIGMAYLCTAQIEDSLSAQETKLEENFRNELMANSTALKDVLAKQITEATTPDPNVVAWRKQIDSEISQIQQDLNAIKSQLAAPTPPPANGGNPPSGSH